MSQKNNQFEAPKRTQSFVQKAGHMITRYSLLIIVGGAALAITFLHFQGRSLWASLTGTPLPQFRLEDEIAQKEVPDKTAVYAQVLEEEKKQRRKKRQAAIVKPSWQWVQQPNPDTAKPVPKTSDTVASLPPMRSRNPPRLRRKKTKPGPKKIVPPTMASVDTALASPKKDFFQPVRSSGRRPGKFIHGVVHGDQDVGGNDRIQLRLEEPLPLVGKIIPAHTVFYGEVRLLQNRLHIQVQRIGPYPVSLTVHDHTYHEGILWDEKASPANGATQATIYRQGNRLFRRLPGPLATELNRNLMQFGSRRRKTVFLPDGFPLFLYHQKP